MIAVVPSARSWDSSYQATWLHLYQIFEILDHQRGFPSKRKSAACVDYVHALMGIKFTCAKSGKDRC